MKTRLEFAEKPLKESQTLRNKTVEFDEPKIEHVMSGGNHALIISWPITSPAVDRRGIGITQWGWVFFVLFCFFVLFF